MAMSRQHKYQQEHYDRIYLQVPKGKKSVLLSLAADKGVSLNQYINDILFSQFDQMLDRMQIAEKYRSMIKVITGNSKDGYKVELNDGYVYEGKNYFISKSKPDIRKDIKKCHAHDA